MSWNLYLFYVLPLSFITYLYIIYSLLLSLVGIISFYSITLYQVYNNSTLSRGRVKLMIIYLFVSIFTWFPIYIWLRTPYNNSGGSGPAWFQSLSFHFWLSSGILYAIAFLGQYKALNDFEIWYSFTYTLTQIFTYLLTYLLTHQDEIN